MHNKGIVCDVCVIDRVGPVVLWHHFKLAHIMKYLLFEDSRDTSRRCAITMVYSPLTCERYLIYCIMMTLDQTGFIWVQNLFYL